MKHPQSARSFFSRIAHHFTSRKLWATGIALVYIRWDFWAVCSMLYTFETPEQVTGFVALASLYIGFVTAILRGYFAANSADKLAAQQTTTP